MKNYFLLIALIIVSGCDFFSGRDRELELRIEREKAENGRRLKEEKETLAKGIRTYIENKCTAVKSEQKSLKAEKSEFRSDAEILEREVSRITEAREDGETGFEYSLLQILKNKTVNEIAVKHLAEGFALQAREFVEKIREARAKEREFKDALKKSNDAYEAAFETSKNWVNSSKAQRGNEVRRLEREIEALEKKRASTRREMTPSDSHKREWWNKMRDYEFEIAKKRRQIDFLRNPEMVREIEARSANRVQDLQLIATRNKEKRDADIHRRLKPGITVMDICNETSAKTIGRLRMELKSKLEAAEKKEKTCSGKLAAANEILLAIPISDMSELTKLKIRADREL